MAFGIKDAKSSDPEYLRDHALDYHEETIDKIVNATYCPRDIVEQIKQTKTTQELNSLGYEFIEKHPMIAYDIFRCTEDANGRKKIIKERFLRSKDNIIQIYAYCAISETDPEFLETFGYRLLENGNPVLACDLFSVIDDKKGLEKALTQIEKNNPKQAKSLREFYDSKKKNRAIVYITPNSRHRIERHTHSGRHRKK